MKDEFLRFEKKPYAKEIRENLTEEGKRLELLVKAELKKRHEQTQELDQTQKNIESSAKGNIKELKMQEQTLSQEGQLLQDLVKTIREHRAQNKDGNFLDKLFLQGAEKIADSVTTVSEKADNSIRQTVETVSNKLGKALFNPPEKPNHPESQQEPAQIPPETTLSKDLPLGQASEPLENRSESDLLIGKKNNPLIPTESNELLLALHGSNNDDPLIKHINSSSPNKIEIYKKRGPGSSEGANSYEEELPPNELYDNIPPTIDEMEPKTGIPEHFEDNEPKITEYNEQEALKVQGEAIEVPKKERVVQSKMDFKLQIVRPTYGNITSNKEENLQIESKEQSEENIEKEQPLKNKKELKKNTTSKSKYFNRDNIIEQPEKDPFIEELGNIFQGGFLKSEFIKQGYGIMLPLEVIEKGVLSDTLRKADAFKDFALKNTGLESFLNQIQSCLGLNDKKFGKLIGKSSYCSVTKSDCSVNLHKLLNLPDLPALRKKFSQEEIEKLKNRIEGFLKHGETFITLPGLRAKLNFTPDCLKKVEFNKRDYVIFPTSQWELKSLKDEMRQWARNFYYTTYIFNKEGRAPTSREFEKHFGRFLGNYLKKYQVTYNDLLKSWDLPLNLERRIDWNDPKTWEQVKRWAQNFYTVTYMFNSEGRSPTMNEIQSQFSQGFGNSFTKEGITYNKLLESWNLPLNRERVYDWNSPIEREKPKIWAQLTYPFGKDGSPTRNELNSLFPGYYHYLRKNGMSYNDFLKSCNLPLNEVHTYNWSEPKTWEQVRRWAENFYAVTYIFEKEGRSPTQRQTREKFGRGFETSIRRKKISYNNLLKSWELPLNQEHLNDWSDPKNWGKVKRWAQNFYAVTYIFDKEGRSPTHRELNGHFTGINGYLAANKIAHKDLLKKWNLPLIDSDQILDEGLLFDELGKDCLKLINETAIVNPIIYNTMLKGDRKEFRRPDGIMHDFSNSPVKRIGRRIYLDENQQIEGIVDFKRSYGSMRHKDWTIYTKLAKKMDIFLLKGKHKSCEVNGCKITFYSKDDLILFLRNKITPVTKIRIESLIEKIEMLDRGVDSTTQKTIHAYLDKK